jgi:hypothetical protein
MSLEESSEIHRKAVTESEWKEIGRGSSPFWLDNQTYGFVGQEGISLATVGEDDPSLWLTRDLLAQTRPPERPPFSLSFNQVFRHPLQPDHFLLIAGTTGEKSELFIFGPESAEGAWSEREPVIRHLVTLPAWVSEIPPLAGIVETGRPWLVLPFSGEEIDLWLYDLAEEETLLSGQGGYAYSLPQAFDWSGDGVWLARPSRDAVDLIAPGFRVDGRPYRRLLFHDLGSCSTVGWVNPG